MRTDIPSLFSPSADWWVPAQLTTRHLLRINSPDLLGHCEGPCNFRLCQTFVLTHGRRDSLGNKRRKREGRSPVCQGIIQIISSTFDYKGRRGTFGGDGNVRHLDESGGFTTTSVCQNSLNCTLQKVKLCHKYKLCLSESDLRRHIN